MDPAGRRTRPTEEEQDTQRTTVDDDDTVSEDYASALSGTSQLHLPPDNSSSLALAIPMTAIAKSSIVSDKTSSDAGMDSSSQQEEPLPPDHHHHHHRQPRVRVSSLPIPAIPSSSAQPRSNIESNLDHIHEQSQAQTQDQQPGNAPTTHSPLNAQQIHSVTRNGEPNMAIDSDQMHLASGLRSSSSHLYPSSSSSSAQASAASRPPPLRPAGMTEPPHSTAPEATEALQASIGSSTLVPSTFKHSNEHSRTHSKSTSGGTLPGTGGSGSSTNEASRTSTSTRRDSSGDVQGSQQEAMQSQKEGVAGAATAAVEHRDGMEEEEQGRHRQASSGTMRPSAHRITPVEQEHEQEEQYGHAHTHNRSGRSTTGGGGGTRVQLAPIPAPLFAHTRTHSRSRNSYLNTHNPQQPQRHSRRLSSPQMSPLMPLVFQPDLPIEMLAYTSMLARIVHSLYPLLYFFHVPITLYLDYSVLYALIQVALHPHAANTTPNGTAEVENGLSDGQPRASPWWIAVGFYALSTFCWFFIVFLLHDLYFSYYKRRNNWNPSILGIYSSAPAFHLSCTRSFPTFNFLWRIRLAAFTGLGSLPPAPRQGVIETSHLLMQNWPTVTTLIPRAFASLFLLLSFTSASSDSNVSSTFERDDAYFASDGTLTRYSIVFNLINASWAIWRILVVSLAALVYHCTISSHTKSTSPTRTGTPADSYTVVSSGWMSDMYACEPQHPSGVWKRQLRDRVIEAVLLCSSTNRWRVSVDDPVGYRQSRSTRPPASKARRKRRSTASMSRHVQEVEEEADVVGMQERPMSNSSFSVHLPMRPSSAPQGGDGGAVNLSDQEIRVSSIPTRRKMTISNESTVSSIFSGNMGTESTHTTYERPFSALGHYTKTKQPHAKVTMLPLSLAHGQTGEDPEAAESIALDPEELDDEERERLEWERHPPLTPRGSLVQAREELAYLQQQKERSYWSAFNPTASITAFLDEQPSPTSTAQDTSLLPPASPHREARALVAIVEESEEEASLRKANSLSNRHTISSRQSSLRRPGTALSKFDDTAKVAVIQERPGYIQSASA